MFSVLAPGVNLEKLGSTCIPQLLWEVLFGSGNLELQPNAVLKGTGCFLNIGHLVSLKTVCPSFPRSTFILKGSRIIGLFSAE
jgi:hypothetical protein